jgi:tyrosyl-tRNA synthetase
MKQAGLSASTSEAGRLIEQGGVRVGGEKISDKRHGLAPGEYVVQAGKRRFARLHVC